MRPERVVAAALLVLAAGLVVLLLFGPAEGTGALAEPVGTVRTATEPPAPTETQPTTTETQPTTEQEAAPTVPATVDVIDVDFPVPYPLTVTRSGGEAVWSSLHGGMTRVEIEASASARLGVPGDEHGLVCDIPGEATYSLRIDPWSGTYVIERTSSTGSVFELERGEAQGLRDPPRPNLLRAVCTAGPEATELALSVNGDKTAFVQDTSNAHGGLFENMGLEAFSLAGAEEVVFDDVVVRAG